MMAEEKQDDLSMEDILSSIKDILDKDTQPQMTSDEEPQATPAEIVVEEPEDDVYDLSKTMIIDEPLLSEIDSNISTDDDIDLNFDDINTNLDNIDLSGLVEEVVPEAETVIEQELIATADPLLEITSDEPLDITTDSIKDAEFQIAENSDPADDFSNDSPLFEVSDINSDPIFADDNEDDASLDALFAQETDEEIVTETLLDIEEASAQENNEIENIDDILSSASKVIYADASKDADDSIDQDPIEEIVTQIEESAIFATPIVVEPIALEEPMVEEKTLTEKDDSTDISANIISNFAKMFADNKDSAPAQEAVAEASANCAGINELGNGSKTISDVVEEVIQNIISASVSAELDSKIDIASYAKAEIKAQTQAWLEANLPSVVEAAVQKEIERVMAKVGK